MRKLDPQEEHIRCMQSQVQGYPSWRRIRSTGGFLLYVRPDSWLEEAFRNLDGTWSMGRKDN